MSGLAGLPLGLAVALAALAGLIAGSFLTVVIVRLPPRLADDTDTAPAAALGLAWPPSHCPSCHSRLRWPDLVPVASWLIQRGRCRHCGAAVAALYPTVELLAAAGAAAVVAALGPGWPAVAVMALTWLLLAAAAIDWRWQLLPDSLVLPGLWAGLLIAALFGWFVGPAAAILGAAGGYLALWLIYQGHYRLTGRPGLGHGDFKLLGLWGAWLGWEPLWLVALLAAGGVLGVTALGAALQGSRLDGRQAVPFGPALAAAGWLVLLARALL